MKRGVVWSRQVFGQAGEGERVAGAMSEVFGCDGAAGVREWRSGSGAGEAAAPEAQDSASLAGLRGQGGRVRTVTAGGARGHRPRATWSARRRVSAQSPDVVVDEAQRLNLGELGVVRGRRAARCAAHAAHAFKLLHAVSLAVGRR